MKLHLVHVSSFCRGVPRNIVPKVFVNVRIEIPPIMLIPANVIIIKVIWAIPAELIPLSIPQ